MPASRVTAPAATGGRHPGPPDGLLFTFLTKGKGCMMKVNTTTRSDLRLMCTQLQWWGVTAEPCNWQTSGTTEADDRARSAGTRASCHPSLLPTEEVSVSLGGRQATFKLFINLISADEARGGGRGPQLQTARAPGTADGCLGPQTEPGALWHFPHGDDNAAVCMTVTPLTHWTRLATWDVITYF